MTSLNPAKARPRPADPAPGPPDIVTGSRPLPEEVEALILDSVGGGSVLGCERLNPRRSITRVCRVALDAPAAGAGTVVVKYARGGPGAAPSPEFAGEIVHYRFLEGCRPRFEWSPRVLGASRRALVLEDLGRQATVSGPRPAAMEPLAVTLASLHAATFDAYPRYRRLRHEAGLSGDSRMYSQAECESFFAQGSSHVTRYCLALKLPTDALESALATARRRMAEPGSLRCFLHDDLASRRQLRLVDGRCYLFDFEMAKFGHALLDLAKPLVGKFERKRGTDQYLLRHHDFSIDFAQSYRKHLAALGGPVLDDREWQRELASALIYGSVVNCGVQYRIPPEHRPLTSFAAIQRSLFARLRQLLEHNPTHPELEPVLSALAERIVD